MKRLPEETEELNEIIKHIKYFRERGDISNHEIREVSQAFIFKSYPEDSQVINYGEFGEHFYIIIHGKVGVQIPNPMINQWQKHREAFEDVKIWKSTKFA